MGTRGATAGNRVLYQEHHDRADGGAYKGEQEPPGNRADDPEEDIEDDAPTLLVHDFAGNKAGDQAQDDPADDGHLIPPSSMLLPYFRASFALSPYRSPGRSNPRVPLRVLAV